MFLGKVVLKICNKFTGEHPCRSAISIKVHCNFIEITLRRGCSPGCFYITMKINVYVRGNVNEKSTKLY